MMHATMMRIARQYLPLKWAADMLRANTDEIVLRVSAEDYGDLCAEQSTSRPRVLGFKVLPA